MSLMDWSGDLQLNVEQMDHQHKSLLDLMNTLYDDYSAGQNYLTLSATFNKLAEATVAHFKDEEAYMESIEFPGLDNHKLIHKSLLEKFGEHRDLFNKEKKLDDEFFVFLKFWLRSHIMGIDTKYANHSKNNAA